MNGRKAKARRRQEQADAYGQIAIAEELEKFDVWRDPETGEYFFADKEIEGDIFPKQEEEKVYPDDPRPICRSCGKHQNETHYVPVMKSGGGGFFTCDDNVRIIDNT